MPLGLKWAATLFAAVVVTALTALACGGASDLGSLTPDGATVVGDADLARIRAELDVESLFGALPGDNGGSEGLAGVIAGTGSDYGIQLSDVTRVEFFGDVSDSNNYFGIIAHGDFDEAAVIAALASADEAPAPPESYKGHDVYSRQRGENRFSLSVADANTLLIGTESAVKASLDVLVGERDAASGELMDTLDGLGKRVFGVVAKAPAGALENQDPGALSDMTGGLPISLDFLQSIDTLGIAAEFEGENLGLKVLMEFADEESAGSMKQFVDGMVSLASGLSNDPNITELLGSLEASLDGTALTITIDVPKSKLGDLTSGLTNVAGLESSQSGPVTTMMVSQPELDLGEKVRVMPSARHVPDGQRVIYNTTPPTSGEHWEIWADCGWHNQELPDERVVHNLEHGQIVVNYNLASAQEVDQLKLALEGTPLFQEWGLARPYPDVPEGTVALAAWGRLATLQGVSPDNIGEFFQNFAGVLGPERIPC